MLPAPLWGPWGLAYPPCTPARLFSEAVWWNGAVMMRELKANPFRRLFSHRRGNKPYRQTWFDMCGNFKLVINKNTPARIMYFVWGLLLLNVVFIAVIHAYALRANTSTRSFKQKTITNVSKFLINPCCADSLEKTPQYIIILQYQDGTGSDTGPLWGESTSHWWIPSQSPVTQVCDFSFDLRLNKQLDKHSRRQWFETPHAHYDVTLMRRQGHYCFINSIPLLLMVVMMFD